jgi:hypothetical protein
LPRAAQRRVEIAVHGQIAGHAVLHGDHAGHAPGDRLRLRDRVFVGHLPAQRDDAGRHAHVDAVETADLGEDAADARGDLRVGIGRNGGGDRAAGCGGRRVGGGRCALRATGPAGAIHAASSDRIRTGRR